VTKSKTLVEALEAAKFNRPITTNNEMHDFALDKAIAIARNHQDTEVQRLRHVIRIANATLGDAIQRMKLFRDEPCDIPDIQHIAAIGVEAMERGAKHLAECNAVLEDKK